ncbi:hypothetical protein RDWZM_010467 [Blomia tropicalis]|uniref:PAS domain-containing protein n=1 Tax=Blomia tropicalis TaxID=40697 RepID=A0A9Q0M128_BLOTA|nr:hypothetical protein RDWZM_010467 [Blomia tropicalis]
MAKLTAVAVEALIEGDFILQALNGFLLILTCEGEVFYTSNTVETYLGFHQSDICHQSVYELVHSEDREELQRHLMWNSNLPTERANYKLEEILQYENIHLLERNFTVRFRCLLDNTSGFLRLDVRGRIKVLYGQNHKSEEPPMALFAVCTPFGPPSLLEMPANEKALFKSKHKLDFSLVSMEQRGRTLLGYNESELSNRGGYDLIHHDDLFYVASAHQELLKTGASGLIAYRIVTKDCIKWQWLQTSARLVYKNSKPDFILCTHRPLMEEEGRDLLTKRTMDFKVTYLDGGLGAITVNRSTANGLIQSGTFGSFLLDYCDGNGTGTSPSSASHNNNGSTNNKSPSGGGESNLSVDQILTKSVGSKEKDGQTNRKGSSSSNKLGKGSENKLTSPSSSSSSSSSTNVNKRTNSSSTSSSSANVALSSTNASHKCSTSGTNEDQQQQEINNVKPIKMSDSGVTLSSSSSSSKSSTSKKGGKGGGRTKSNNTDLIHQSNATKKLKTTHTIYPLVDPLSTYISSTAHHGAHTHAHAHQNDPLSIDPFGAAAAAAAVESFHHYASAAHHYVHQHPHPHPHHAGVHHQHSGHRSTSPEYQTNGSTSTSTASYGQWSTPYGVGAPNASLGVSSDLDPSSIFVAPSLSYHHGLSASSYGHGTAGATGAAVASHHPHAHPHHAYHSHGHSYSNPTGQYMSEHHQNSNGGGGGSDETTPTETTSTSPNSGNSYTGSSALMTNPAPVRANPFFSAENLLSHYQSYHHHHHHHASASRLTMLTGVESNSYARLQANGGQSSSSSSYHDQSTLSTSPISYSGNNETQTQPQQQQQQQHMQHNPHQQQQQQHHSHQHHQSQPSTFQSILANSITPAQEVTNHSSDFAVHPVYGNGSNPSTIGGLQAPYHHINPYQMDHHHQQQHFMAPPPPSSSTFNEWNNESIHHSNSWSTTLNSLTPIGVATKLEPIDDETSRHSIHVPQPDTPPASASSSTSSSSCSSSAIAAAAIVNINEDTNQGSMPKWINSLLNGSNQAQQQHQQQQTNQLSPIRSVF